MRLLHVAAAIASVVVVQLGCRSRQPQAPPGAGATQPAPAVKAALLMETYDVDRWARDQEYFEQRAAALGAEVWVQVADGDQDRQNKQADTMLTRGANVLVVVPKNLATAARIITSAHAKNVPVVAYDRLIRDCDLDIYVTFDNEQVGYLQAQGVLRKVPEGNFILMGGAATDNNAKLLRAGQLRAIAEHAKATGRKISVLDDRYLTNWDREEARQRIANLLTKFEQQGAAVHAIVASNDSTAGGAVAALKAENLAGQVAVSGQDAELTACQRVVEGTQTVTVYKPVRLLAAAAAEIAVRLAGGERPEDVIRHMGYRVHHLDNGKRKVPSVFLPPVFVTAENMAETVVKDQWHPLEKIYANVPKDRWPKP